MSDLRVTLHQSMAAHRQCEDTQAKRDEEDDRVENTGHVCGRSVSIEQRIVLCHLEYVYTKTLNVPVSRPPYTSEDACRLHTISDLIETTRWCFAVGSCRRRESARPRHLDPCGQLTYLAACLAWIGRQGSDRTRQRMSINATSGRKIRGKSAWYLSYGHVTKGGLVAGQSCNPGYMGQIQQLESLPKSMRRPPSRLEHDPVIQQGHAHVFIAGLIWTLRLGDRPIIGGQVERGGGADGAPPGPGICPQGWS